MTLNGVMAVILRYFSEFVYLAGILRKSSRSLSPLDEFLFDFENEIGYYLYYYQLVIA